MPPFSPTAFHSQGEPRSLERWIDAPVPRMYRIAFFQLPSSSDTIVLLPEKGHFPAGPTQRFCIYRILSEFITFDKGNLSHLIGPYTSSPHLSASYLNISLQDLCISPSIKVGNYKQDIPHPSPTSPLVDLLFSPAGSGRQNWHWLLPSSRRVR